MIEASHGASLMASMPAPLAVLSPRGLVFHRTYHRPEESERCISLASHPTLFYYGRLDPVSEELAPRHPHTNDYRIAQRRDVGPFAAAPRHRLVGLVPTEQVARADLVPRELALGIRGR